MANSYYVYIIQCSDDSLYTGIATDVARRVTEHNGEKQGGAKYTYVRRPVQLMYSEHCTSRSQALKREYVIKQMNRNEKLRLIRAYSKEKGETRS